MTHLNWLAQSEPNNKTESRPGQLEIKVFGTENQSNSTQIWIKLNQNQSNFSQILIILNWKSEQLNPNSDQTEQKIWAPQLKFCFKLNWKSYKLK